MLKIYHTADKKQAISPQSKIIRSGFPSPALDYAENELDLNSYCIRRPNATFFFRACGEAMTETGLKNGDLLIVDRAESPRHGDIVVAEADGEFAVRQLLLSPRPALRALNPASPLFCPETLQIFGVVMAFVHKPRNA